MNRSAGVSLEADISRYEQSLNAAARITGNLVSGITQLGQQAYANFVKVGQSAMQMGNQTATGLDKATKAAGQFTDANGRMREANGRFVGGNNSALGSLGKLTLGYLSASKALELLKQGLEIVSDYERIDASLKAVSTSSEDYAHTQNFLKATSDNLGISYEALAGSYKGLKAASNGTTLQGAETERIFLAVAHAGASLKLSNDEVKGSLLAIQQMMSKGTVQAEELRGQLGERLPGAFGLMARAIGVTEQQLGKMLESGQVMAADVLPKLATELEKTYGAGAQANVNTMAGGFTRATDQLKLFLAEFAKENNITSFFAKLGNGIGDYLKGIREAQRRGESLLSLDKPRRKELASQADQLTTFRASSPEQRQSMLAGEERLAKNMLFKLKDPRLSDSERDHTQTQLIVTGERIRNMRRANLALTVADRVETERLATAQEKAAKAGIDPAALLKQKKDRFDALKDKKGGLATIGQSLPKAEAEEYARLSKELDKAAAATKKYKETKGVKEKLDDTTYSDQAYNKRIAAGLERKIQDSAVVDPKDVAALAAIRREMERLDALASKNQKVDIAGIKEIKDPNANARVREIVDNFHDIAKTTPGMFTKTGLDVLLNGFTRAMPSLDYYRNKIEEIKKAIATLSLPSIKADPEKIKQLTELLGTLKKALSDAEGSANSADVETNVGAQGESDAKWMKKAEARIRAMKATGQTVKQTAAEMAKDMENAHDMLAGSAAQMLEGIGEGLSQGANPLQIALQAILSFLGDFLIRIGTAMVLGGTLLSAAETAFPFLGPLLGLDGPGGVIAGGALIVGGGVVKGISSHEKGGFAKGESIIRVGESYKARAGGGELIAPIDEGAKLMSREIVRLGGMGNNTTNGGRQAANLTPSRTSMDVNVSGELRAKGGDLALVLDRYQQSGKKFGNER